MGSAVAKPRREAILDSALDVFLERGVVAASIEEVRTRSGASVGSLYHHFGGKEGLAGAVHVAALSRYQTAFLAELRNHADAEGGVRGGVTAHLRWCLRDCPREARFLLFGGEVAREGAAEELRRLNHRFFAEVMAWWAPHARYGALRHLELDLAYALWLGAAQEHCRLRLSGRTTISQRRAASVLGAAAWQALRGDCTPPDPQGG